jgi:hypothetical protein
MKKLISAVMVLAAAGMACAGELEKEALSVDLSGVSLLQYGTIDVPVPAMEKAPGVSPAFVSAVKKEYESLMAEGMTESLFEAKISELPAAAQKQLKKDNAQWGPDYLSVAYKMPVHGQTVYVIKNENDGGMFVTIFNANGALVAEGSCSESGDFKWSGDKGVAAVRVALPGTVWADNVKRGYADKGISGVLPHTLLPDGAFSLLPGSMRATIVRYRKQCLDMQIGTKIDMRVYKLSGGYLVQCKFDEYTFASLFDADGRLLAEGSADSSEFGWNN